MKIYVDMLFIDMKIETILIDVEKNMLLNEVKKLVQEKSYVYPEEQIWFHNNNPINNQVIEWNEKINYSIIVNNKWYDFTIKSMTNMIVKITHLTSRDLISTIKHHVYEKLKILPESYKLTASINGKQEVLIDNQPIGKYFLPDNSTINLVIKLNSGY